MCIHAATGNLAENLVVLPQVLHVEVLDACTRTAISAGNTAVCEVACIQIWHRDSEPPRGQCPPSQPPHLQSVQGSRAAAWRVASASDISHLKNDLASGLKLKFTIVGLCPMVCGTQSHNTYHIACASAQICCSCCVVADKSSCCYTAVACVLSRS